MRPSGRTLIAPDGKGQTLIHGCTVEGCDETEAHPFPWPRPDFVPELDPTQDQNVCQFMHKARESRAAREAEMKKAGIVPPGGSDG